MAETVAEKAEKTPTKYFDDQFDDEEVLYVFHKHPIVMRKGLVIGLVAWLLGPLYTLALTYIHPNNPPNMTFFGLSLLISIIIGFILFTPSWIGWHFSVFIVTDQRFIQITQKGLFHRAVADITLIQIQSVNYEVSGLQETLLGFGTIKMQTYVGDLTIREVSHPAKIQKKLLGILRQEGISTNTYPAAQQPNQAHEETEEDQEA
ncbi:MAG TPA: PH domain-containing protein [Candidatus Dormibacteraeota bacterium]|nr:PH domain-containing protein [Candidatus Dormibacteraeota bacterium]